MPLGIPEDAGVIVDTVRKVLPRPLYVTLRRIVRSGFSVVRGCTLRTKTEEQAKHGQTERYPESFHHPARYTRARLNPG